LLPGGTATFANYTNYYRGLNGVMVDVTGLAGTPTAGDFEFRVGNDNNPSAWSLLATAPSISVRAGAGDTGASRITLIWPDFDIRGVWLQVTMKPTANTGLATPDVFYFGNAVGESGNSAIDARVTTSDELFARNNPHSIANPTDILDHYDYNRDTRVSTIDQLIARNSRTTFADALNLIQPPAALQAGGLEGSGSSAEIAPVLTAQSLAGTSGSSTPRLSAQAMSASTTTHQSLATSEAFA